MSTLDILFKYHRELLSGLLVTLKMCSVIYPVGTLLGIFVGTIRYKYPFFLGSIINLVSLILSSTPIIVFLFWLHYPFQYMLKIVVEPFVTAVFALTIVMIFLVSDAVSNSLKNFPIQLIDTARVCGLTYKEAVMKIQLPIIFRQLLPNYIFILTSILQMTLFASLISVNEIFRVAQQINSEIYKPVQIYTGLAFFFIAICATLNLLAAWLKNAYKWKINDI